MKQRKTGEGKKQNKTRKEEEKKEIPRGSTPLEMHVPHYLSHLASSKPNLKEIMLYQERRLERMEENKKNINFFVVTSIMAPFFMWLLFFSHIEVLLFRKRKKTTKYKDSLTSVLSCVFFCFCFLCCVAQ